MLSAFVNPNKMTLAIQVFSVIFGVFDQFTAWAESAHPTKN